MKRKRFHALIGSLIVAMLLTSGATPVAATPSPSASADQIDGTREVVAVADGQESRYLAPARTKEELQAQIDAHLKRAPGGKQINENEISYGDGRFVVTFALPGQDSGTDHRKLNASDCNTTGWYCFYDGINFTYPRGRLSDCGWQDLDDFGWSDRTESVAQPPYEWYVLYLNHLDSGDQTIFWTDDLWNEDSDVSPYRNMADHADKWC